MVYAKKSAYPAFEFAPVLATASRCWIHDDIASGTTVAAIVSKIEASIAEQNVFELCNVPHGHSPLRCD